MDKRLFIACDIPDSVKDSIVKIAGLFKNIEGVKIVKKQNMHITLAFLGDTPTYLIDDLKKIMNNIPFSPFEMELKRIVYFPSKRSPRVAAVEGESQFLADYVSRLRGALKLNEFDYDPKPFRIHITFARFRRFPKELPYIKDSDVKNRFTIDNVVLYSSNLTPKGPIYTVEYKIGGTNE